MILRQKSRNQLLFLVHKAKHECSCCAKNFGSYLMMAIDKQNNRHTILPQTHIVFIVPRSKKGLGRCHKSGTGKNQGRRRTNPRHNRGFNRNECHSKSNELPLTVIYVSLQLDDSVINPPQLSSVCQQSSRSSHNTPRDNQCLNSNHSNSKSNELSSTVIPMLPPWNDSVINPTQLSSVRQQSSRSSHNTTHELQASSIPGRT